MADLTITPANVGIVERTAVTRNVQIGESVTAGQALYLKVADGKYWLADCLVAAEANVACIAATGGAADDYVVAVFPTSKIDIGATVDVGTIYVLSESGGIMPAADLAPADYVTVIGVGITTAQINFKPDVTGVLVPA